MRQGTMRALLRFFPLLLIYTFRQYQVEYRKRINLIKIISAKNRRKTNVSCGVKNSYHGALKEAIGTIDG